MYIDHEKKRERERVYVQIIININTDLLGGAKEQRVHDNVIYYQNRKNTTLSDINCYISMINFLIVGTVNI